MYQGRQSHGWFGSGTAPPKLPSALDSQNDIFDPANVAGRVDFVARNLVSQLPPSRQEFQGAKFDEAARKRLKTSVAAWYGASALTRDAFRDRLLPWYVSDSIVNNLRAAARRIVDARDKKTLAEAGLNLAFAMQKMGMEWWPAFLVGADKRAIVAVSKGEPAKINRNDDELSPRSPKASGGDNQEAPLPQVLAQSQTCAQFIAENCRASILRVFPGQFLNVPIEEVLESAKSGDSAARTAKKLLQDNRFRK